MKEGDLLKTVVTATPCNTLQHAATHCNTLQHTATHCTAKHGEKTLKDCCQTSIPFMECPMRWRRLVGSLKI